MSATSVKHFAEYEEEEEVQSLITKRSMPLSMTPKNIGDQVRTMLPVAALGSLVICISASMIHCNKYLMHADRFPFPIVLVLMHCVFCSLASVVLLVCRPSLFPSLTCADKKVAIDKEFVMQRALPVALFFSVTLVLGNTAYQYCSVAFLQMMKESNIVTVYVMSVLAGTEILKFKQAVVLIGIFAGTVLTVRGDLNFSAKGFMIQGTCCLCESIKSVVQGILLSGTGKKLDAMSYVLVVMPLCGLMLAAVILFHLVVVELPFVTVPSLSHFTRLGWLLPLNTMLAFALNVAIALFISYSSPLSFMISMIIKDAMIVLVGTVYMGELVSKTQYMGFFCQITFIVMWTALKVLPAEVIAKAGFAGSSSEKDDV